MMVEGLAKFDEAAAINHHSLESKGRWVCAGELE